MRKVHRIHQAIDEPIGDLVTFRAMPTDSIEHIDPFLFLNHHGRQVYPENNSGLPFGPHPHRGFATVTFILKGDLTHQDSSGSTSTIKAGGVQWMTAGRGLVHSEVSSPEFLKNGGELEILQLWVNLPARRKMIEPFYSGKQAGEIPEVIQDRVRMQVVSGTWEGTSGAFSLHEGVSDVQLAVLHLSREGRYTTSIPSDRNVLFYVVQGRLKVNGTEVQMHDLMEFSDQGTELIIEATTDSVVLLGHAEPYGEPIVAHGPFVMNTQQEIVQAYEDYRKGLFGNQAG